MSFLLNFTPLFIFKYYDFLLKEFSTYGLFFKELPYIGLGLPLGISFYTFQTFSYSVDVYKKKIKAENNIISFALYVSFFPQLIAGPIERAKKLLPQFKSKLSFDYWSIRYGLILFFWGLFKKIVIADRFGFWGHQVFDNSHDFSSLNLFISGHLLVFQFYCDFSGYSDMARGLAKMLGINLSINFKSPFYSSSPIMFWRRWHITLINWLTDYIFYPLIGNSTSYYKRIYAVITVFLLSGIWHGANLKYILWGLFIGICVASNHIWRHIFKKKSTKKNNWVITSFKTILTFYHFYFLGVLVNAQDMRHVENVFRRLLNIDGLSLFKSINFIPTNEIYLICISFILLNIFDYIQLKHDPIKKLVSMKSFIRWPVYSLSLCFILITAFQLSYNQAFLYFQF